MAAPEFAAETQRVLDATAGYLLGHGLRLVLSKAFAEPIAAWFGQRAYRQIDQQLGGRLPDLPSNHHNHDHTPDHP